MKKLNAELAYPIRSILGEGSLWDAENQRLLWVDILDHKVYSFDPNNRSNVGFDVGSDVGTVVLTESNQLAFADQDGLGFLNTQSGEISHKSKPESANSRIRFNDGKCDPRGTFWAGTMAYDCTEGMGKLYEFDGEDNVKIKIDNTTISNGLVWSKDQNRFYFIDSTTYCIHGYDYDPKTGEISNKQIVAQIDRSMGLPDGMAIDEDDHLWVALFDGGKVVRISPENGGINYQINVPAPKVTSCAFGGADLNELYITTASYQMTEDDLTKHPLSGSLFKVRVPFQGTLSFKMKNQ